MGQGMVEAVVGIKDIKVSSVKTTPTALSWAPAADKIDFLSLIFPICEDCCGLYDVLLYLVETATVRCV